MRYATRTMLVLLSTVFLLAGGLAAQKTDSAQALLRAATDKAVVDGDLNAAIKQYQTIVDRFKADRAVVATALVQMAECYRKLGDSEATKIYERLLREFSDQKEAAAVARARLGGTETVGRSKGDRPVWTGPGLVDGFGTISPDGRYLSYTDWGNGGLMLRDLVAGTDRRLTAGLRDQGQTQFSTISRDGKQVAYEWLKDKKRYELRVASLQGTGIPESRRLLDLEDAKEVVPYDWSPDGKWLAVNIFRQDNSGQIGLVSVRDGALRVLKSVDWRGSSKIFFSPDGRYIAYSLSVSDTSNERHVFVMAIDGSREAEVVDKPLSVIGSGPLTATASITACGMVG